MFISRFVTIMEYQAGLMYENGRYIKQLGPGRHRLLTVAYRRQDLVILDIRRQALQLPGQEMLTSDSISVRLNLAAEYRVADPALAVHGVTDFRAALYTELQLLLRDQVQLQTIDSLLADRAVIAKNLLEQGAPRAAAIGLELISVGIRDIVLPGEVKRMLSQEVEAQRKGRAALVTAREEVAATRARANTAQLLANSPVLLRLREMESLAEVAGGHGNTVVLAIPSDIMKLIANRE